MRKKQKKQQSKEGEVMEVKIRDRSYRTLHKSSTRVGDQNGLISHISVLEKYWGITLGQVIKIREALFREGTWI